MNVSMELEYAEYLKKKVEGPPDLGPAVAKYQNKP